MMGRLVEVCRRRGLKVNADKSKVIGLGGERERKKGLAESYEKILLPLSLSLSRKRERGSEKWELINPITGTRKLRNE